MATGSSIQTEEFVTAKSNLLGDKKRRLSTRPLIPQSRRVPRIETRNRIPPWCERATARAARATARPSATSRWAPARCCLFWRATPTTRRCPDRTRNRASPTRAAATRAPRRPRADAPRCTARYSSPTRPSRRSLTSPWGGRSSRCVPSRTRPFRAAFPRTPTSPREPSTPGSNRPIEVKHPLFLSNAPMPSAMPSGRADVARPRVSSSRRRAPDRRFFLTPRHPTPLPPRPAACPTHRPPLPSRSSRTTLFFS